MKSEYKYLKNSNKRKSTRKNFLFIMQIIFFILLVAIFFSVGIFLFYKKVNKSSSFTIVDDAPQILKNVQNDADTYVPSSNPEIKIQKETSENENKDLFENENLSERNFSNWNKSVPLELQIVNKSNSLPEGYKPDSFKNLGDNVKVSAYIYKDLIEMIDHASKDKVKLWVCSGYRSYARQKYLFDAQVEREMKSEKNYEKSTKKASEVVAKPGQSEHNLGLAVDMNSTETAFENTDAYKWLSKNAYKHGFIERYRGDKTNHTGVIYEPWHYRYVGKENAKRIMDSGLCLEEFAAKELKKLCKKS